MLLFEVHHIGHEQVGGVSRRSHYRPILKRGRQQPATQLQRGLDFARFDCAYAANGLEFRHRRLRQTGKSFMRRKKDLSQAEYIVISMSGANHNCQQFSDRESLFAKMAQSLSRPLGSR